MSMIKKEYGLPDMMIAGGVHSHEARCRLPIHPLEKSEKEHPKVVEQREFQDLRSLYGIQMPLKLSMERNITRKTGHLPVLPRHNFSYDVITGRDEVIEFSDFLGHSQDPEGSQHPHVVLRNMDRIVK